MKFEFEMDKSAEAGGFGAIPKGRYHFKITKVLDKMTEKGNRMATLKCELMEENMSGALWHNLVFIPKGNKGHGMIVHFHHCLGLEFDGKVMVNTEDFIGKEFLADIEVEIYNGTERNKIKQIYSRDEAKNLEVLGLVKAPDQESELPF